jgi:Mg/Co/Ni transporter MgtE
LATEGTIANHPTAASVARRDTPTCGLADTLGDVREKLRAASTDVCVVTNGEGIVLGLLRMERVDAADDVRAEEAMRPGPSTFRPHVAIEEMAKYMTEHDLNSTPITTSEGGLVGVLFKEDALRAVEEHFHAD